MKILFFILGDIYKRLLEGREESFKKFLDENDIVFFGPIPSSSFEFNGKCFKVIQVNQVTSISDLYKSMPGDWHPEIAVIETPVINLIPDFYKIDCKTLCYPRDSWADMIYNRSIFDFFDFNHYQTVDKHKYLNFLSSFVPLTGNPTAHLEFDKKLTPFENRTIDVLSIATTNEGFYHKRAKTFNEIAASLYNKYNILFVKGIPKSKINTIYGRSRIVIDFSYVASNRAYEAIGNGCLLFSYEGNPLIKEVFEPNQEYATFSIESIVQKIEYYLNNPKKAQEIIDNGRKKLETLPKHPGEANLKRIDYALNLKTDIDARISNIDNWPRSKYYHATATPLYFNYNYPNKNIPQNWKELYFERIEKSLQHAQSDEEIVPPLLEAGRMAFLMKNNEKAIAYLDRLIGILPDYAWTFWLKAKICFENKEFEKSEEYVLRSIDIAKGNPELFNKYILPFVEKGNTADQRRIGEYLYDGIAFDNDKEYQFKTFMHLNYELLGDIYALTNIEEAKKLYIKSIEILIIPEVVQKVAMICLKQNDYDNLLFYIRKGLEDSPYDNKLIVLRAIGLLCSKSIPSKEYYRFLQNRINVFACYGGNKRINSLKLLFTILNIFRLSKKIHKNVLLKMAMHL